MIINKTNYTDIVDAAYAKRLPKALQQSHEFYLESIDLYGQDKDIDETIDLHLEKVNQWNDSQLKKEPRKRAKKDNSTAPPKTCPPVDNKGVRRIDKQGLQALKKCIDDQPTTASLHKKDGTYTPDRQKLHDAIVQEFKDGKPCVTQTDPICILTGGPPGSGKSTFLKKWAPWILSGNLLHIDADEVRAKLPEYKGWNADRTQEETSHIVNRILKEVGEPCNTDMIYDGTMNKAKNYIPLIDKIKGMGYKVFVVYIQVPKETSISRAMARYQKTGRYVPIEVINEVYERGLTAYEEVIKMADGFIRVDNGGKEPKIVEKGGMEMPKERDYNFAPVVKAPCPERAGAMAVSLKKNNVVEHPDHGTVTITGIARENRKQVVKFTDASGNEHKQGSWAFRKAVASSLKKDDGPEKTIPVARAIESTKQSAARDESTTSKKVYAPTAENVQKWAEGKPGDLSGVDTANQQVVENTVHKERDRTFMGFLKALLS